MRASAERAGFHETRCPLQGKAFSLDGIVSPCVQVFFQRVTFSEVAPFAFLGVYIDAFEREWRERLLRTNLAPEFEDPVLAIHDGNVGDLGPRPWAANSPSGQDVEALLEWLGKVFEYAKSLPSSVESLVEAVRADKIGDHKVSFYLGHPVKVRAFVQWLRRTLDVDIGQRVLPLIQDRTEPYDVSIMLGEP